MMLNVLRQRFINVEIIDSREDPPSYTRYFIGQCDNGFCLPCLNASALNHRPSLSSRLLENRPTALAPWMSKTRSSELPFFVIDPSRTFPPEPDCDGT